MQLVEIDADRMAVSRRFMLKAGRGARPGSASGALATSDGHGTNGHGTNGHAKPPPARRPGRSPPRTAGRSGSPATSRTSWWRSTSARWTLRRRIPAGDGIYNLAASPDGRLVVATNKRGQSVSVFEAASGRELARIPTTRRVPSGLVDLGRQPVRVRHARGRGLRAGRGGRDRPARRWRRWPAWTWGSRRAASPCWSRPRPRSGSPPAAPRDSWFPASRATERRPSPPPSTSPAADSPCRSRP